ncbi:Alpha/beta hydrolase fold-3 [Macrophomina phaseolina MS6]|uniref:Alpha/beta hydrolase fold-3 n=1 Tax=Macrophomina phaseolina (strain MS6) TaxID=1126212 RepID=K2SQ75_MACPH|nr:Alpha/beta hydrolase fold-3 [Macrophomina phaseolina MS6]
MNGDTQPAMSDDKHPATASAKSAASAYGDLDTSDNTGIDLMHRRNRTARTTLLHQFLRPFRSQLVKPSEPFPPGSPRLTPHPSCAKICGVHERQVAGIWLYDLEPKTSHKTTSKATTSAAASHLSTAGEIAHEAAEEDTLRKNRENAEGIVRRIYYIAGGSWREPPSHQHWKFMAKLAAATPGTAVSVVSVPLAPNETAQTVFPRLLTLYERVMEESTEKGERALWAGDSSGGNIVLGLVGEALRVGRTGPDAAEVARRASVVGETGEKKHGFPETSGRPEMERGKTADEIVEFAADEAMPVEAREGVKPLPAPSALLIICPSVDARRENEKIEAIQDKDPILIATESKQQAADWAGDWSLDDERISPAVNYTGKDNLIELLSEKGVKVHGITAGYDILSPDAIILRERLEKGGVYGKWLHWDKQMHCFPLAWFYGLPESKEGLHWIIRVLQEE